MLKVLGDAHSLLSSHGKVDVHKLVAAIDYITDFDVLDVEQVNSMSDKGGIYIENNGHILDTYKHSDEEIAKYKIIPTGLRVKGKGAPLFASFIKANNEWEGAFIGTASTIFQRYSKHYNGSDFDIAYKTIFENGNEAKDITGFGLSEILCEKDTYIDCEVVDKIKELETKITKAKQRIEKQEEIINSGRLNKSQLIKEKRRLEISYKEFKNLEDKLIELQERTEDTPNNHLENNSNQIVKIISQVNEELSNVSEQLADCITTEKSHNCASEECNKDEDIAGARNNCDKVCMDIYNRLMFKENWLEDNKNKLSLYLRRLITCIYNRKNKSRALSGNGYIMTKDRKYCLLNTGLLDKYGNFIYLIDKTPMIEDYNNKTFAIMNRKAVLIDIGFEAKQIRYLPEPFEFVSNPADLIFRANIEDFDLDDSIHLRHIIEERKFRFPKEIRNAEVNIISDRIKDSIRQAVMISKADYRYVIPMYNLEAQGINFLIPIYLRGTYGQKPDLALVVGKKDSMWRIYTVISTDDAVDNVRLMGNVYCNWLA